MDQVGVVGAKEFRGRGVGRGAACPDLQKIDILKRMNKRWGGKFENIFWCFWPALQIKGMWR